MAWVFRIAEVVGSKEDSLHEIIRDPIERHFLPIINLRGSNKNK